MVSEFSAVTLGSLDSPESIVVHGGGPNPCSFACGYPVISAPFVKKGILSSLDCLGTLSKTIDHQCKGFISGFSVLFH